MTPYSGNVRVLRRLALVVVALAVPEAIADSVAWTGKGGNNLWDTPANWDKGRVPAEGDDVLIQLDSADVLVGSEMGGAAQSVTLDAQGATLTLRTGAGSLALGSGGLLAQKNARVAVDMGGGTLSSAGPILISQASSIEWTSGTVDAKVIVGPQASARLTGVHVHTSTQPWTINGQCVVSGGGVAATTAAWSVPKGGALSFVGNVTVRFAADQPIGNEGTVVVTSDANGVAPQIDALGVITVENGEARCVVNGTTAIVASQLLLLGADVQVNITAKNARLEKGSIAKGVLVSITDGSIAGVGGNGNVTSDHQLNLDGNSTLNDLSITGTLTCSPNSTLSVGHAMLQGNNEMAGCAITVRDIFYDSQQSHGNATWTVDRGDFYWQGFLAPTYTFTFNKRVLVCPMAAVLYSTVVVAPGATASMCGLTFGADGNGQWVNHGTTMVEEGLMATMSWIQLKGDGTYSVQKNASLALENVNATLPAVSLLGQGATLLGSGVQLGWAALAGAADGAKISIVADNQPEETCTSPCGPRPEKYYQKLTVRHT